MRKQVSALKKKRTKRERSDVECEKGAYELKSLLVAPLSLDLLRESHCILSKIPRFILQKATTCILYPDVLSK